MWTKENSETKEGCVQYVPSLRFLDGTCSFVEVNIGLENSTAIFRGI